MHTRSPALNSEQSILNLDAFAAISPSSHQPPHWMDLASTRAYLLNFYTDPAARGHANLLLRAAVAECRTRGLAVVTLHASRFGRPIYEKFGFKPSTEMMFRFDT